MWVIAMFDLPVKTKKEQKRAAKFRNLLLREGFSMLQFSIYARYCSSEDTGNKFRDHIRQHLPASGNIRLLMVTDRQFGKMDVFHGKTKSKTEQTPSQLMLF
tara:strand:- start:14972 stop:15277 length:306 start_codon:yes stop_codon:yes gene_type:complete